jgi:hypothetical protein
MRATENIAWENVLTPATAASGFGVVFSVGVQSVVCRLTTDTNDDPGADDAFELYTVLAYTKSTGAPTAYYPIKELDPVGGTSFGLLLGGNMTQAEIVIRGDYVWKKIEATTPAVGIEVSKGYERI